MATLAKDRVQRALAQLGGLLTAQAGGRSLPELQRALRLAGRDDLADVLDGMQAAADDLQAWDEAEPGAALDRLPRVLECMTRAWKRAAEVLG